MVAFFHQYPVIVPFIVGFITECLKAGIDFARHRQSVRFWHSGGMPSGHSALVTSALVIVALTEGIKSSLFVVMAVVAYLVIYDAVNLRYQAGRHAHFINVLRNNHELDESLGHTPLQVAVGILLGGFLSYFLYVGF